jgi:hypothetical protein
MKVIERTNSIRRMGMSKMHIRGVYDINSVLMSKHCTIDNEALDIDFKRRRNQFQLTTMRKAIELLRFPNSINYL